jgi:hypothetical protein
MGLKSLANVKYLINLIYNNVIEMD